MSNMIHESELARFNNALWTRNFYTRNRNKCVPFATRKNLICCSPVCMKSLKADDKSNALFQKNSVHSTSNLIN